eukprot:1039099_1
MSCTCSPFSCFTTPKPKTNETTLSHGNKAIEKHMKLAKKMEEKTLRLLLLGPGSSGKTTILKQIKKIHSEYDTDEVNDRRKVARPIQNAVIEYMQILCVQSVILHEKHKLNTLVSPQFEDLRRDMLRIQLPINELSASIAYKIETLWSDKGIKATLDKRCFFNIHDNVSYFLDQIKTVASPDYFPSFDDYLRFRQRTTGFSQTNVIINCSNFGTHKFEFTDVGGQRSERKKWMRFISEDINAVLYILAISDYDLTLFEDDKTNRLVEAIDLFRNIMLKGKFFSNKSVLIFFNKYDLFKEKIKRIPITVAFDDFPEHEMNPNDDDDVIRFVAGKFLRVFEEQNIELTAPLHIVRTTALDTNNIDKIVADITMDLVQQNLKNYGYM